VTSLPKHLVVGMWHSPLCALGTKTPVGSRTGTFLKEATTCPRCLVLLDRLEELGSPLKTRPHWLDLRPSAGGEVKEVIWSYGHAPSHQYRKSLADAGRAARRVDVISPRSLHHHAEELDLDRRSQRRIPLERTP